MFMGVPYAPFFLGAGGCLLLSMYLNLLFLLLIFPVMFTMRQLARRDEMVFRLIGLRWLFKLRARNVRHHAGLCVFSPNRYGREYAGTR